MSNTITTSAQTRDIPIHYWNKVSGVEIKGFISNYLGLNVNVKKECSILHFSFKEQRTGFIVNINIPMFKSSKNNYDKIIFEERSRISSIKIEYNREYKVQFLWKAKVVFYLDNSTKRITETFDVFVNAFNPIKKGAYIQDAYFEDFIVSNHKDELIIINDTNYGNDGAYDIFKPMHNDFKESIKFKISLGEKECCKITNFVREYSTMQDIILYINHNYTIFRLYHDIVDINIGLYLEIKDREKNIIEQTQRKEDYGDNPF